MPHFTLKCPEMSFHIIQSVSIPASHFCNFREMTKIDSVGMLKDNLHTVRKMFFLNLCILLLAAPHLSFNLYIIMKTN